MSIRTTPWLLCFVVCLVLSVAADAQVAQAMGPAALATRQDIKNQVVDALSDGNISLAERAEILSEGREVLQPQEYEGLIRTMDRLSSTTHSEPVREIVYLPPQHGPASSGLFMRRELSFDRLFGRLPYLSPPRLQRFAQERYARNVARRMPYAQRPQPSGMRAGQFAARFPRMQGLYVERPAFFASTNPRGPAGWVAPPVQRMASLRNRYPAYPAPNAQPRRPPPAASRVQGRITAAMPLPYAEGTRPSPTTSTPRRVSRRDTSAYRAEYLQSLRDQYRR